ncbi:MAG TPA: OmpH family outer membrane protein [Pyrinomonadaceae bacterium]|nr:OmpH family outer membrane protein [Pyrinomonadaceae bacterium]
MKVFRTTLAAIAVAAFTILVQTLLTMGASSAETVTQPAAPANIGIIDSSRFDDDKAGIARVTTAMKQLEVKFQPLQAEIRGMGDRLNALRTDLQKKQAIQDAATTSRQVDEANSLELQIKRKAEDARTSYQKEVLAIMEPLQNDLGNAVIAFAQTKGITLVLDSNRVPIIYAAPTLDITQEFINEYNRTHPAGSAPAPARTTPVPARPTTSPAKPTRP